MSDEVVSDIGEDALVEDLVRLLDEGLSRRGDVLVGAGDDCAVIARDGVADDLLLKADAVIEGIHYLTGEDGALVGEKALKRTISDVAAMGGWPTHALVAVACPAEMELDYLRRFYRGLARVAGRFGVAVVGGDTAGLPAGAPAVFSISLLGRVPAGEAVLRSGASPGDHLYVTGKLGGSLPSRRHLEFEPRVEEGAWLREQGVSAMMDLSDGLGKDLPRMARASGCGFLIERELLPLHPGCTPDDAVGDGEDYELLFACPHELPAVCPGGLPLVRIGEMVAEGEGQSVEGGWEYFTR